MNNFSKIFSIFSLGILFASCSKSDPPLVFPIREYSVQYVTDLDSVDKFINTHYLTVDTDFNVVMPKIPVGGSQQSIRVQTDYPLQFKMVSKNDVNYKVYYLSLREGVNERPSRVDSVYVAYRGVLTNDTQFDFAQNPVWFELESVVPGWPEIIPLFKTGNFDTSDGPNPATFTDFGAGVMFLPSGLGYFDSSPSGAIPAYTPLIFSFKLLKQRYRDHDRDGILSKDEVDPKVPNQDPKDYDTDKDGFPNMFDFDDDGDNFLTRKEIHKNPDGTIIFEDTDQDGIPNYLDPDNH